MASEYKKRGGGYTTDKKDEKAKHLDQWTEEEWQTKEGDGKAKQDDGTEKRYLPKKAWEQMSEKEKEETDAKKQKESKEGKQHVANTSKAKDARKDAQEHDEDSKDSKQNDSKSKKNYREAKDCTEHWEDPDHLEANQKEYKAFQKSHRKTGHAAEEDEGGSKRGRGANSASSPNKKQKTGSGAHDEPTGSAGDKTRVPKKGQKVQWKALPGYVDGEVVEIVYEEKKIDGKNVKASKEDPRIVLKSDSSGKICVHKPEAVYFD